MATIPYTVTAGDHSFVVTWPGVTEADTCQQYSLGQVVSEVSFHSHGTWGSATVTVKGGNVTGGMLALSKINGAAATATANSLMSIAERPLYIQPVASGGTGQSLTFTMLVRR